MTFNVNVSYKGDLACDITYNPSNYKVITQAKDEKYFSPVDLLAGALAACTVSHIAYKAEAASLPLDTKDISAEIKAIMTDLPVRKVDGFDCVITVKGSGKLSERDKAVMEGAAKSCPVRNSLAADLKINCKFDYR